MAAALAVYVGASLFIGREILAHLSTAIANDAGDPILTTSILHWIGSHVPYSDAWYQLPIFYPSRDTLTFSEHLLGVAVVAAPIEWLTGSAVAAYNVTVVLSFMLSAAAMFALGLRLTRSVPAAFIAGLAYGFAPYRISQLPHIQMEVVWWAPLALLGLHAYLDTGRVRWLVVYGVAWTLQGAANGYMLVFLSVLIGVWTLWFVIAQRRWRELTMIAAATVIAVIPLAPILLRYVQAHRFYGMVRSVEEIKFFSADIAAIGCAPPLLTVWGWVRVGCRPEGELFPGVALFALFVGAAIAVFKWGPPSTPAPRWVRIAARLLLLVGVVYAAIALSVWRFGPWSYQLGPLRVSSSSVAKPLLVSLCSFLLALLIPPGARMAARRASTTSFYVLGAVLMWLLALGPRLRFMDKSIGYDGPYDWVMLIPGGDGLRVPARFWMVAVLCLAVVAALFVADVLKRRQGRGATLFVALVAVCVLADGWVNAIPVQPLPPSVPNPAALAGRTVLDLPMGDYPDIGAQYRAVLGGWRTINGYSGFAPLYYPMLTEAANEHAPDLFDPLQELGELDVVVRRDAAADQALVRALPDVITTAEDDTFTQFRLPEKRHRQYGTGRRVPIASVSSTCAPAGVGRAIDSKASTEWVCGPEMSAEALLIDLGREQDAGGLRYDATFGNDVPRQLIIETSIDGVSWMPARQGSAWGAAISAAMRNEQTLPMWFPFEPRRARYVRLSRPAQEKEYYWRITELEVWTR
jgi:hypothetical protein